MNGGILKNCANASFVRVESVLKASLTSEDWEGEQLAVFGSRFVRRMAGGGWALWGTVVSGLEEAAAAELERKIPPEARDSIETTRGRLAFTGPVQLVPTSRAHLS